MAETNKPKNPADEKEVSKQHNQSKLGSAKQ